MTDYSHNDAYSGDASPHAPHTVAFDATVLGQIKTFGGHYVTPLHMQGHMFHINDIAHSLSRICRYIGHCAGFLSVAEHCVLVSRLLPPELKLDGLLHDRMEAYLGDVARPIKRLPEMQFYRDAEEYGEKVSAVIFGVRHPIPQEVMDADAEAFAFEVASRRDDPTCRMMPDEAKRLFLHRYYDLVGWG